METWESWGGKHEWRKWHRAGDAKVPHLNSNGRKAIF